MIIITSNQLQLLRKGTEAVFSRRAAQRLCRFFPRHTAAMNPDALAGMVDIGIGRARHYRLTTERGIQTYLSLMIYLGSEFHRDPQYPWATAMLEDVSIEAENARVNDFIRRTGSFLAEVAGPNREHVSGALRRLLNGGSEWWFKQLEQPVGTPSFQRLLTSIYPEKVAYLGQTNLIQVMTLGLKAARRHGLDGAEPVALFACLLMLLGSFADEDPQFTWIRESLAPRGANDSPARRFENLLDVSFGRLRDWMMVG